MKISVDIPYSAVFRRSNFVSFVNPRLKVWFGGLNLSKVQLINLTILNIVSVKSHSDFDGHT